MSKDQRKTKYTDFVRVEVYALHRLTISLHTFFIAATSAILFATGGLNGRLGAAIAFWLVIGTSFANIIITYVWIHRSLYRFYNRLDKPEFKYMRELNKIKKTAKHWENVIRWFFYSCSMFFISFLLFILN
jgi:hypothetical protein